MPTMSVPNRYCGASSRTRPISSVARSRLTKSHAVAFSRSAAPNGFSLQEAARAGFEVAGIELATDTAEHARGRGLNVTTGIADEATLATLGAFDVIVLLDVIEHLEDPLGTLVLCERHLNPGGVIVLTTGDFGSLVARMTGASWRLMTPPQHLLWFFSGEAMRRLAPSLALHLEIYDHPWKLVPLSLILFQISAACWA